MVDTKTRWLRAKETVSLALAVCLLSCIWSSAQGQSADEADLRVLAERFFAAYQKKDLAGAASFWSAGSPDLAAAKQDMQETFIAVGAIDLKGFAIRKVTTDRQKATVRVVVNMSAVDGKTGKASAAFDKINRTLHCVKEGADWKIWRHAQSEEDLAAALVAAGNEEERAALMAAEKDLVTAELDRALIAQGRRLISEGRYQEGLMIGDYASKTAAQIGDQTGRSLALRLLGGIYYFRGDYAQALEYMQKGLEIKEAVTREILAASSNTIGAIYLAQGNFQEALVYFHRCLKISEEDGDKETVGIVLNNIGNAHKNVGNYARSLEYHQRSLELTIQLGDKEGVAVALQNIGDDHYSQGNHVQALEYFQKSLKLAREIGYKGFIPTPLANIGEVYESEKNYALALKYYQESLALAAESGDKAQIAHVLNPTGNLYRLQGNYDRSLEHYQRSLKLSEEIGQKRETAEALVGIARLYEQQGNYERALETARRGGDVAGEINFRENSWAASTIAGRCYRALDQPEKAAKAFADAIAVIEELRGEVAGGEQEEQRFFESKVSPYYAMVDLLISRSNAAEALAYAERAKARALLDVLRGGRVDVIKAMTKMEQDRERRLKGELVSLNAQVYNEKLQQQPDEKRLADLDVQLRKARLEYEAFQTNLYAAHSELKTQRGETPPITVKESSTLVTDANTALLEFVVMEDKTYLLVLTRSSEAGREVPDLKVYKLNIEQKDLTARVQRFRQRLAAHDFAFQTLARQLYDALLKPARAQLQNKTMLIVVPDGVLWELPFQALQPAQNRYLIEDCAISYAPSLTVLRETMKPRRDQQQGTTASPTLLAFGNPIIGETIARRVKAAFMDKQLMPLPEAERQVRMLGRLYGAARSKIYVGSDAREDRLKLEAGNYRILHLATHGILNNASPMYSHLVLSQVQEGGSEDGLLEAWEIMNLELTADLVVLSACDTARGRLGAGEGVIGLAWALFVAGCPTTVASQWKVESSSTTALMIELHRNLKPKIENPQWKITKAEALRRAALKLLRNRQYRHPFYWAAFVMIGAER